MNILFFNLNYEKIQDNLYYCDIVMQGYGLLAWLSWLLAADPWLAVTTDG